MLDLVGFLAIFLDLPADFFAAGFLGLDADDFLGFAGDFGLAGDLGLVGLDLDPLDLAAGLLTFGLETGLDLGLDLLDALEVLALGAVLLD